MATTDDTDDTPTGPDALVDLLQLRVRERLISARERAGMTQGELGRRLGITRQHASAFERGRFGVSAKRLALLEEIGFDLTELVQPDSGPTRLELARVVVALMLALQDGIGATGAGENAREEAEGIVEMLASFGIDKGQLAEIVLVGDERAAKLAAKREGEAQS